MKHFTYLKPILLVVFLTMRFVSFAQIADFNTNKKSSSNNLKQNKSLNITATTGVSELAGCGPNGEGRIRATNIQGGTPPYEFSYDNQLTWITDSEIYVLPGTYSIHIKDSSGIIIALSDVSLEPEPIMPTVATGATEYNCDGTANTSVTVTNNGTTPLNYTYFLDGVENLNTTDPRTFLNVSEGSHTISINYELQNTSYSELITEDFGYGANTSSTNINTAFCYENQLSGGSCGSSNVIGDGEYSITARISNLINIWVNPTDHTSAGTNPNGRFLVVNFGTTLPVTEIVYEKQINDIIPNQPINVRFSAFNILRNFVHVITLFNSDLRISLLDTSDNEIATFSTGPIPKSERWEDFTFALNPGNNTSLRFVIRSNLFTADGNEVAIDDISVFQKPKSCNQSINIPFTVNSGNAFIANIESVNDASCFDSNNGSISIAVQNFDAVNGYQYSINGGTNWNTILTSPYTISNLSAGNYGIQIRHDAINNCQFNLNETVDNPTLLGLNITTAQASCNAGGQISVEGFGGTPNYIYELLDTNLNIINLFPNTGIIDDVPPGDYIIRITDNNTCQYSSNATVETFETLAINLVVNDNQIVAQVTGGSDNYEFRLDSTTNPWTTNNVFNNVSIGKHRIYYKDALLGCEDYEDVFIFGYPKFFTPNGDGFNDVWTIYNADLSPLIPNSTVHIYDRYGKLIMPLNPRTPIGWDGTYNGFPLPVGDYWFVLEYDDFINNGTGQRKTLRSHFSLKR